jgi:hypothetical protein
MLPPELLCGGNISILGSLRATIDDMHLIPNLAEVHSIAGAKINFQFHNSFSKAIRVAKVAVLYSINSISNNTASLWVKAIKPFREWFSSIICLADEYLSRVGFHKFIEMPATVSFNSHSA